MADAWEVTDTGARVYAATGGSCSDIVGAFIKLMREEGITNERTVGLMLSIGFVSTEVGFEGLLVVDLM